MAFQILSPAFEKVIGPKPTIKVCLKNEAYAFAHEAGVFIPGTGEIFITSNRLIDDDGNPRIQISRIIPDGSNYSQEEIFPDIPMANGGVNYGDGVVFCSQGTQTRPSALIYMKRTVPFETSTLVQGFYGRDFNSINDVVVHEDGSFWFTDPIYGFEQGFKLAPQLPNQVYRFDPATKSIRVMADGFGRPNGIAFSPDQRIVYITDTDIIHGDGTVDHCRPSTM